MKRELPFYKIGLLMLVVTYNMTVYFGTRVIAQDRVHYDLGFSFEEKIPLIPWTVFIYLGCYLFWIANYILSVKIRDKAETCQFVFADLIGKSVCLLFYLLLPTTMQRPEIVGNGLAETLLRGLYQVDAADNLFPSIHCLVSWLCYVGVRKRESVPVWYRGLSLALALAVCISTLTVKQHVLIDVFAGIFLAEFGYRVMGRYIRIVREKRHAKALQG